LDSCYIRPLVFRGYGDMGVLPTKDTPIETYIAAWEWGKYLGEEALAEGVDVCVSSWTRIAPNTLPAMAKGMNMGRAYWDASDEPTPENEYVASEDPTKQVDALWERAEAAEKDGNLRLDRDLLNEYLKRTEVSRDLWFYPTGRQQRRNSAIDRLDALSALDRGSNASKVKSQMRGVGLIIHPSASHLIAWRSSK